MMYAVKKSLQFDNLHVYHGFMPEGPLPKTLLDAREAGTLVPFVGAGVSMAVKLRSGADAFPSWSGLLARAAERMKKESGNQHKIVEALLEQRPPEFLDAAKRAREGLGALWPEFLEDVFDIRHADIDDESLDVARAIWGLGSKLIITTNYDRVLSWACPDAKDLTSWSISPTANLLRALRGEVRQSTVWHLHGSTSDTGQMILAPDGYQLLYSSESKGLYAAALQALRQLMASRHFLFVGFSFSDEYFGNQLRWLKETFQGFGGPHYVLARGSDADSVRERTSGLNVVVVPFDDFGAPMLDVLRRIGGAASERTVGSQSEAATRGPGRKRVDRRSSGSQGGDVRTWGADELGVQTAATARDDDSMVEAIAGVTGLGPRQVRRRLNVAHGRSQVRNIFPARWIGRLEADDDAWDIQELGQQTAAAARGDDFIVAAIAGAITMDTRWVRRHLNAANGRTRVRRVFEDHWPTVTPSEIEDPADSQPAWELTELGSETAAAARNDQEMVEAISAVVGMSTRWVRRLLNTAHGRTRVRRVFETRWPNGPDVENVFDDDESVPEDWDEEELGEQTAASARDDDGIIEAIGELVDMTTRGVRRRLNAANGRTKVRNVFEDRWPDASDESEVWNMTELGTWTAAAARQDDEVIDVISATIEMDTRWVRRHLNDAHGSTHVRNVFADRWPGQDDADWDADELGDQTTAAVRSDDAMVNAIGVLIGMDTRWVRRHLNAADGRMLVRNVFDERWPA